MAHDKKLRAFTAIGEAAGTTVDILHVERRSGGSAPALMHHRRRGSKPSRGVKRRNQPIDPEPILATAGHPFYVRGKGWVKAEDLLPGDAVRTDTGDWAEVQSVADTGRTEPVYNLQVEEAHTYFVRPAGGTKAVLVHNDSASTTQPATQPIFGTNQTTLTLSTSDLYHSGAGQVDTTTKEALDVPLVGPLTLEQNATLITHSGNGQQMTSVEGQFNANTFGFSGGLDLKSTNTVAPPKPSASVNQYGVDFGYSFTLPGSGTNGSVTLTPKFSYLTGDKTDLIAELMAKYTTGNAEFSLDAKFDASKSATGRSENLTVTPEVSYNIYDSGGMTIEATLGAQIESNPKPPDKRVEFLAGITIKR